MRIAGVDHIAGRTSIGEFRKAGDFSREVRHENPVKCPRIALLTPYTGGNLGDAAIQDAVIANLRLRFPDAQFSGMSLNCDNFVERHGTDAFPLCASHSQFYAMYPVQKTDRSVESSDALRRVLKQVPALWWCLKRIRSFGRRVCEELRHCAQAYRFLRTQDLVIVSGGGQLDQEWGGPWGHPFTLTKWGVLARIARVPYAIASVGACKIGATTCRLFLSVALRMAQYRSYRDKHSRELATGLLQRAARDLIAPDIAFSLPSSALPPPAGIRSISRGRVTVAISPIAYGKPGSWPSPHPALYNRYVQQMAKVWSQLLHRDYFLVVVWSSLGDDDRVIPEILEHLDDKSRQRADQQMHIPAILTWKDLVASLQDVDFLIASRLHSVILGFVAQTPTVAISFDPKVDWVMEDLAQTEYLLHIQDFTADDVVEAFDRIERRRDLVVEQIASYQQRILSVSELQYHRLANLVLAGRRCHA